VNDRQIRKSLPGLTALDACAQKKQRDKVPSKLPAFLTALLYRLPQQ